MGHRVFRAVIPTTLEQPPKFFVEPGFAWNTPWEGIVEKAGFTPDLFLYIEPLGLIPQGLDKAPFPTACILCDTHTDLKLRLQLARFFDHVFLYHRNYLKYFTEHLQGYVHWSPYACDLDLFKPAQVARDFEIGFVGHLQAYTKRAQLLQTLAKRYHMNEQKYYQQAEIPSIYARSKLVVNIPLADDLNFRTFEAMSCGALLLTRRETNGQELLFEEGKHLVTYADDIELFSKVDYYLANTKERERIALNGLNEIQAHHRLEQRLAELLNIVQTSPAKVAPIRQMSVSQIAKQYALLYEQMHRWQLDPSLSLIRSARQAGNKWITLVPPALRSVLRGILR
jgi:hypothetical protein